MTEITIRLRWVLVCHECGHEHVENEDVNGPGVEFAPPTVPGRCEGCNQRLQREPLAWHRTFTVEGFVVHD